MRILMITPYPPSPIRVRALHLLRGLAHNGHTLHLLCPVHNQAEARDLESLRPICAEIIGVPAGRSSAIASCLRALPTPLPLQAAYELQPALVAAARAAIIGGNFDVVHVEHLRAAQVALAATVGLPTAPPLLLDAVDCISLLFERTLRGSPALTSRLVALLDVARTRRYEAMYAARFAGVVVTSPEDAWAIETLRAQYGAPTRSAPQVVANGVDQEYFAPRDCPRDPATVIFSGKMSYHANHAAALFLLAEIMPRVWHERPEVNVIIAGAQPAPQIRAFARDPRVVVTGYVPDLRPFLARATLAVAPMRYGVGIQNKVLEAMAMGTPVITSRQTTQALAARPGRDLLVAEGAADFAHQIGAMLANPHYCRNLSDHACQYVAQHHSWAASVATLENCYANAIQPKWIFSGW